MPGRSFQSTTDEQNKFKYQGKERDIETGYDYFEARFYDSAIGRFLQVDPHAEEHTHVNAYNYSFNSPVNIADPSGKCPICFPLQMYSIGKNLVNRFNAEVARVKSMTPAQRRAEVRNNYFGGMANPLGGQFQQAKELVDGTTYNNIKSDINTLQNGTKQQKLDVQTNWAVAGVMFLATRGKGNGVAITSKQLQKKFKHASDFGVEGNYNSKNSEKFQSALESHLTDNGTQKINGTYHKQDVTHYYNQQTGNNVVVDKDGNFVSGWKLSDKQRQYLEENGSLGGN